MTIGAVKKVLSFWQVAPLVIEEGEESYTANLFQQCRNKKLMAKGEAPLDEVAVVCSREKRRMWQASENAGETSTYQECWNILGRLNAKMFMNEAEKEKQEGRQGQRQRESLAEEYFEHVKCCEDTDCTPRMMKHDFFALKVESGMNI